MLALEIEADAVVLPVKTVPGASRTRFMGEWDGRAKIAVAAPPEKGKANTALLVFLAKGLGVRKSCVRVLSGATSTTKRIRIEGVHAADVRRFLEAGPRSS
jgi:uncharacterized protein (TIGR00251 family)